MKLPALTLSSVKLKKWCFLWRQVSTRSSSSPGTVRGSDRADRDIANF